eukprot:jgi/Chrzof1/11239/Cz05g29020.t1
MSPSKREHSSEEQAVMMAQLRDALSPDVHVNLLKGGEEGVTEATLRRWLAARKWVLEDALRDLTAHAQWRAQFVPNGRILESEIASQLTQNKCFCQGVDRQGRAIIFLSAGNHVADDAALLRRFLAYCLDLGIKMCDTTKNPERKMTGIFDLEDFSLKNADVSALRAVFDMLQNHYPERLGVLYLYCAPVLFWSLWKIVQPFVDPVTRQKVVFVYKKEAEQEFAQVFDPEVIPKCIGGSAALVPVDVAWKKLLAADDDKQ